jgi:hypothetical protein
MLKFVSVSQIVEWAMEVHPSHCSVLKQVEHGTYVVYEVIYPKPSWRLPMPIVQYVRVKP